MKSPLEWDALSCRASAICGEAIASIRREEGAANAPVRPAMPSQDALDEALCFGWVDSLVKRLDDWRYVIKFTPRREDSRWSAANRKRYEALKASGRLKPAGISRAPTDRGYDPRPAPFKLPSKLPPYIETALRKRPAALRCFQTLAPSHRRRYVGWIESGKREETKARRLKEAIRLLATGSELGLK